MPFSRIGVLTRTNKRAEGISQIFSSHGLPHVTVEQFRFFERAEIKDALACLKILVNPRDKASVIRALLRLARGVGESTITDVNRRGEQVGLALSDFMTTSSYIHGDPFYRLTEAWHTDGVVVLDVETTDIYADVVEVVEIAAARIAKDYAVGTYRALLRNTVPVGPSESIHHYRDDFLRANGRDPVEVFEEFSRFVGESIVAGHNAQAFDVPVIESHMCRLGLPRPGWVCYDTLDLAQRSVRSAGYSLEVLADTLGLSHKPTHKALDDVLCTCDLLGELIPQTRRHASDSEFLLYRCVKEGRHLEEVRVFYVAMTRARKQLFITYPVRDRGYSRGASPFLRCFEPECVS